MEKFTKLGLSKELTDVLKRAGFKDPTEIQEQAIPPAIAGKDIIGGSETGSGKTLAFASAIIENLVPNKEIQAIILTPTRELAVQVANSIRDFSQNKNLHVLAVYGGVRIETQINKIPITDILVGTPGRIIDHLNRRTLRLNKVKFLVLDEVDRMFDMGFSRDVEKIINECPKERQTMMFSATISADLDYFAKKYTKNPVRISLKPYVDPLNLKQVYYDVPDHKKFSLLVSLLKKENADLVMVFCNTRRNVDFIADNLIRSGIHAKAIHGGLEQKKRIRVLEEFHKKGLGVLVCTDVAARGLDIKGVTHIYNYDTPIESKDYIHRIGRTARAGKQGKAITILASRDYENFRNLTESKEIKITPERMPQLEIVRIKIDSQPRENRFNKNPRNNFNKTPRRFNNENHSRNNNPRKYNNESRPRTNNPRKYNNDKPRRFNNESKPRTNNYGPKRSNNESRPREYNKNPSKKYGDNARPKRNSDDKPRSSYNRKPTSRRPLNKRNNNFKSSGRRY
ncbi:MAG: DEAD/DEAH box helicase [Nanoarchaeota archaeon]|nr:DEAD/DEAH box helicase [Nanoarchaeota archaeon]